MGRGAPLIGIVNPVTFGLLVGVENAGLGAAVASDGIGDGLGVAVASDGIEDGLGTAVLVSAPPVEPVLAVGEGSWETTVAVGVTSAVGDPDPARQPAIRKTATWKISNTMYTGL